MRKRITAQLLALSAALALPGLAAAQFPYSAWNCDGSYKLCSPALIPSQGEPAIFGEVPTGPEYTAAVPQFSDDVVNRFEQAFSQIKGITKDFVSNLPDDATAADTQQAREQAHSKALQALQSANLDRNQYNLIAKHMYRDIPLRNRVIGQGS